MSLVHRTGTEHWSGGPDNIPGLSAPQTSSVGQARKQRVAKRLERSMVGGWPHEILKEGSMLPFKRGACIYQQGGSVKNVYLVLSGTVTRVYYGRNSASVLSLHGSGEMLGVSSLHQTVHLETLEAHNDVVVLKINQDVFTRFVHAHKLLTHVAEELEKRAQHDLVMTNLCRNEHAKVRLRYVLWSLAKRFGIHGDARGRLIDLGLTRRKLASLCAVRHETCIRMLKDLEAKALITTDGRRIFIPDLRALLPWE